MTPPPATAESPTSEVRRVLRLRPTQQASALSRAFLGPLVERWDLGPLDYDAALVTTELVTNAVLHAQRDVVLALRPIEKGVRIEVTDQCPAVLPHMAPDRGGASVALSLGESGRGLRVVSELAARWGVDTTHGTKTVWAELVRGQAGPTEPLLQLEYELMVRGGVTLRFVDLPTMVAVESGVQVEDVVRAIQLEHGPVPPEGGVVGRLYELLLATAADRLAGRHAALWASAEERASFDLEVVTTGEAMRDLGELSRMLEDPSAFLAIAPPPPPGGVVLLRRWLREETAHQLRGGAPRSFANPEAEFL
ncbi:MAG TPA: ATP-binding protein [Acidimicrobiales bacterium]